MTILTFFEYAFLITGTLYFLGATYRGWRP